MFPLHLPRSQHECSIARTSHQFSAVNQITHPDMIPMLQKGLDSSTGASPVLQLEKHLSSSLVCLNLAGALLNIPSMLANPEFIFPLLENICSMIHMTESARFFRAPKSELDSSELPDRKLYNYSFTQRQKDTYERIIYR